jgi:hypothetical protein
MGQPPADTAARPRPQPSTALPRPPPGPAHASAAPPGTPDRARNCGFSRGPARVVHTRAAANSGISCDDSPAPNRQARSGREVGNRARRVLTLFGARSA